MSTSLSRATVRLAALRLALLVPVLLCAPAFEAQQVLPDAVRDTGDSINADQLARDLEYLASDGLAGRNTPSPGFDEAAQYIAKRLERAGVRPAGDGGTFFQRYVMRESQVDTAGAWLEVGGRRLRFGDDFVIRSFAGALSGALPVVYVGHGWTVPSRSIDPYSGVDVRGKLVLAHGPRALPKGVEIRQIGRVNVGAGSPLIEAHRRGAAGIVFVPQSTALKNWAQWRDQNTVRRELDPPVPSAYAAPPVTSILLSRGATEALFEGERITGADLIAAGDAAEYPASFQLEKRATLNVPIASTTDHRPYNVVGIIGGSDPALKAEYITIASHLDGAVGARTIDGDGIYNSADDNASGSAATLSIAEAMMKGPRPKRSLIFIWDSGEERGLWGTRRFVDQPPVPFDRIVAHVNVDMIGATRAPGSADAASPGVTAPHEVFLIGPRVLSPRVDAFIERVNASYLNLQFNRTHDRAESEFFYPRTDAGPFLERGVLTIGFTTGIHDRYHLPADEARHLDPKKMEAIARTVYVTVWMLADAAERPRIETELPETVPRHR